MRVSIAIAIAIAMLGFGLVAGAAESGVERPPIAKQKTVDRWEVELQEIDQLLVDGQADIAYDRAARLLKEALETLDGSAATAEFLSVTMLRKALAAVRAGKEHEGVWHWQIALQIFPKLAGRSLDAYGQAGALLLRNPAPPEILTRDPAVVALGPGIVRPVVTARVFPEFPRKMSRKRGTNVMVSFRAIIGEDGRARDPYFQMRNSADLTLAVAAAEALRNWRFDPATREGEAVACYLMVSVGFRIQ